MFSVHDDPNFDFYQRIKQQWVQPQIWLRLKQSWSGSYGHCFKRNSLRTHLSRRQCYLACQCSGRHWLWPRFRRCPVVRICHWACFHTTLSLVKKSQMMLSRWTSFSPMSCHNFKCRCRFMLVKYRIYFHRKNLR